MLPNETCGSHDQILLLSVKSQYDLYGFLTPSHWLSTGEVSAVSANALYDSKDWGKSWKPLTIELSLLKSRLSDFTQGQDLLSTSKRTLHIMQYRAGQADAIRTILLYGFKP